MYTTLFFLYNIPSMNTTDFVCYYETKHVTSIVGPENMALVHKRCYTHLDDATRTRVRATKIASRQPIPGEGETVDFDVATELGFESFKKWEASTVALARAGQVVVGDEDAFLDRMMRWRDSIDTSRAKVVTDQSLTGLASAAVNNASSKSPQARIAFSQFPGPDLTVITHRLPPPIKQALTSYGI